MKLLHPWRPVPPPPLTVRSQASPPASPSAAPHPDSFCAGMRPALRAAHFFSLVPAHTEEAAPLPRFRWRSFRTAYALIVMVAVVGRVPLALSSTSAQESYLVVLGESVAHVIALSICVLYFRLGVHWERFAAVFARVERNRAVGDRYPPNLGRNMKRLTATVFCLAIAEHTLDRASLFSSTLANYSSVQDLFDDSISKLPFLEAVIIVVHHITAPMLAFLFVFNDLFIMLVSLYVSTRIHNMNSHLHPTLTKGTSDVFWEEARASFDELSKLIKEIDAFVNKNVLLSFTQNLFFICLQLYFFLRLSHDHLPRKVFRIVSFVYIVVRTYTVAFLAARIHDHSKLSRTMLFSVSSRSYCREVQRFIQQAASEEMALSGCNMFRVTRAFILTVRVHPYLTVGQKIGGANVASSLAADTGLLAH